MVLESQRNNLPFSLPVFRGTAGLILPMNKKNKTTKSTIMFIFLLHIRYTGFIFLKQILISYNILRVLRYSVSNDCFHPINATYLFFFFINYIHVYSTRKYRESILSHCMCVCLLLYSVNPIKFKMKLRAFFG